ncbi:uncharacterized protein LOC134250567 [Saccostrea cucullata]|uniref:uncharacterized protein LOC134250567 n=1 Tax=Saccostrea cuccullata TaxID=36930 RepID=UPI002ED31025
MRKRKNYTNTQLMSALEDMRKNKISAEKASKKYNIPVRTLRYRQKHVMKGYPNRCLTTKQEESLVNYIKYCAERAFPLTRKMIKAFVREIIDKEGNSLINVNTVSGPSDKWFRGFLKRHPDIALRTPDSIDRGRYGMANSTVMRDHFQLLEKCLTDLGIRDKPSQIFNVDETGFGKCEKREKVVAEKVRKHTYA